MSHISLNKLYKEVKKDIINEINSVIPYSISLIQENFIKNVQTNDYFTLEEKQALSLYFAYNDVINEENIANFNKGLLNKVSEPIAGNTGVFVLSVNALGAKPAQQDPSLYKEETLQRLRNVMFRTNVALKKAANIKDNRSKVY